MDLKYQSRQNRKRRIRAKIFGTSQKPRLAVFKSNNHIYCQLIDDENSKTLAAASDLEIKNKIKNKMEVAAAVGEKIYQKAKVKKITQAAFDRAGFKYHGRVKALAEGARKAGLKI